MSFSVPARQVRATGNACLIIMALTLGACSSKTTNQLETTLGTSSGVAVTSSTGSGQLAAGDVIVLTATVAVDTKNAGVTWALDGDGSLSNITTTSVTYSSPAAVTGTSTPIITATSITDSTQSSITTLVVAGSPLINAAALFPGNVNTPYATAVSVAGGTAPYVWSLSSGAFPDGITEAGSNTSSETLTGTPTVIGSFPFQMTVADAASRTATINLTLVINPAATCLLGGRYVMLTSGIKSGSLGTRAAGINIDVNGAITGVTDRKNGSATNVADTVTGTCINRSANAGQLLLTGPSDTPNFNFAINTSLLEGRLQLTNGGDSESASGLFYLQTPSAFSLSQLAGSFAFGLLGADSSEKRLGLVGQLTVNSSGVVTAGRADSNASSALTAAALTGAMSAPDANGRGTLSLSGGGQTFNLGYYVVTADRLVLVSADSAANTPRLSGFMTRRATSFSSASLASPGILSLWGSAGGNTPNVVVAVGRLSAANTTTGAISLLLDTANRDKAAIGQTATSASYSVEADGRVTLNTAIGGLTRNFTMYLDATANGYVIEQASSAGSAGLLEAQSAGPFDRSLPGLFVSGTQFPQGLGPLALVPLNYIANGTISSGSGSGFVAIDSTTGRGIGTISISGLSNAAMAFYVVRPTKVVMMRFGDTSQNAATDWLVN